MTFKVQVGPPQIAIHQGQTVLLTDLDGQIAWPSDKGLYFFDTRVISAWAIYANGQDWDLLNGGPVMFFASRVFLTNQAFLTEDGSVPARTLGLIVSRSVSGGLHEDLDLTNHGSKRVCFNLEIAMRSDFADIFEVKSSHIVRRGRITTDWSEDRQELRTTYRNADFLREITVRPHHADSTRRLRQRTPELRVGARPGPELAFLPALRTDRRQAALPRPGRLHGP